MKALKLITIGSIALLSVGYANATPTPPGIDLNHDMYVSDGYCSIDGVAVSSGDVNFNMTHNYLNGYDSIIATCQFKYDYRGQPNPSYKTFNCTIDGVPESAVGTATISNNDQVSITCGWSGVVSPPSP